MATRGCATTRTTSWCAVSSTCSSTPATSRRFRLLEKVTDFATKTLDRSNNLADPSHNTAYYGVPQEWYTLSENLFRAYRLTGNPKFKTFAEVWLYHAWWNKFARTSAPPDAHGVHAYSHVNTFSSAAMAYDVLGDASYLQILKNGYDYLQQTQVYATGGYGPNERFMAPDGSLGRALDTRSDTAEIVCGSWAGFKMARYLMQFTGEARYGDWIERLFYNGVGAALPLTGRGRNFYYGDYRVGGGMKVYNWDNFTCCSGTYIQNMADYYNLAYYKDAGSLYVNLYVPSEVTWQRPGGDVVVEQETLYPEAETSVLTIRPARPSRFALKLRVPSWTRGMSVKVNGAAANVECRPGTWATIDRTWAPGDKRRGDDPADAPDGAGRPSASRSRRGHARPGRADPRGHVSRRRVPSAGARRRPRDVARSREVVEAARDPEPGATTRRATR